MEELRSRVERLQKQLRASQDREVAAAAQTQALRQQLSKKTALLADAKGKVRFSEDSDEVEQLRANVRMLEDRLKDVNRAEKPFEDVEDRDKVVKNAQEVSPSLICLQVCIFSTDNFNYS